MGFDDFRGSVYELDDNEIYTGEVRPMWDSKNKKKGYSRTYRKI